MGSWLGLTINDGPCLMGPGSYSVRIGSWQGAIAKHCIIESCDIMFGQRRLDGFSRGRALFSCDLAKDRSAFAIGLIKRGAARTKLLGEWEGWYADLVFGAAQSVHHLAALARREGVYVFCGGSEILMGSSVIPLGRCGIRIG